jgi:hypothetical protein
MSCVIKLILNDKDEATFEAQQQQLTLQELMEKAIASFPR